MRKTARAAPGAPHRRAPGRAGAGREGARTAQNPSKRPFVLPMASEKIEGTVLTLEGAWDSPGTVAPSRCLVVCHRPHSGRAIPAGLGTSSSLRCPSWRAGCITKGACPVREGGSRKPTGGSRQGAGRPPHQNDLDLHERATRRCSWQSSHSKCANFGLRPDALKHIDKALE